MGRYMRKLKEVVEQITVVEVADHSSGGACDNELISISKPTEDKSSTSPHPVAAAHVWKKRRWTEDGESSYDSGNLNEFTRNTRRRCVEIDSVAGTTSSCQLPAINGAQRRSEEYTCPGSSQTASCCSSNGDLVEDRAGTAAADPTLQEERDNGGEVGTTLTFSDARSEKTSFRLRSSILTVEFGVPPLPLDEAHNLQNSTTEMRWSEVNSGLLEAATTTTTANDNNEMPSAADIEEFFSNAEKDLQKCFTDRYNFDVVDEVPLGGGRYDWVRIKP